ncbi:MAG: hypothetical protein GC157_03975 [Frankiales bacterium]|nr:hypothetical protein [Frankiales bacterium]
MDDNLQATLRDLLRRGAEPNAVLDLLVRDYQRFHLVLVLVSGLFLALLLAVGVALCRSWGRARHGGDPSRRFERRALAVGAVLACSVPLLLAVVVAANVSTVLSPRQGFTGSVRLLGAPAEGTRAAAVQESVTTWLAGARAGQVPAPLERAIDDRLSWQRPKAVTTTVLLVVVSGLGVLAWRRLVRRTRRSGGRTTARDLPLLLGGCAAVPVAFVLMLMVMGNTQGALAPLSLTLFLG